MDPSVMFQPQGQPVDDLDALEMAFDDAHHARDVPQDWPDANPYEIDTAPEAGEGYEDMGLGESLPMEEDSLIGAPQSVDEAQAMRDAMLQRMQEDSMRSEEYQGQAVEDNKAEKKIGQKMGY